uniref:Carrier domain-containing protein n=1 Tax=Heterorhabditis bacteriophora TaxID=37862 RepID=A0A1I7WU97_HETBA
MSICLYDLSIIKKNELQTIFHNRTKQTCNIPTSTIVQILQQNRSSLGKINCKYEKFATCTPNRRNVYVSLWGATHKRQVQIYCKKFISLYLERSKLINDINKIVCYRCAAIVLQRDCDLILTIMAVWKSGLIAVPIDIDWPEERIAMTAKMFENPIFLQKDNLNIRKLIEQSKFPVLDINNIFYLTKARWFNLTGPLDLMYITCTSGTTGIPKAVCIEYAGHSNLGVAYTQNFALNSRSRVYQVVNYGFDIFFADIVKTIINGASLTLREKNRTARSKLALVLKYLVNLELIAYVKFKMSSDNIFNLKAFLAERVPDYYIIEVDKFPLNVNGKIDFKKLPQPAIISDDKIPMKPAETLIEKKICEKEIMVNQCFFDAGGDSLKAMLVTQELTSLGYLLDLKEIFSLKTAEKIAQLLKKKQIN